MNTSITEKNMTTKTTENGHSQTRSSRSLKGTKVAAMANDAIDSAKNEASELADRGHEVIEEGESLLARFEDTLKGNPYMALGIGAGAGLLVGTVFGSRIGRMALLLAGGYVASEFIKRGGIDFDALGGGASHASSDDEDEDDADHGGRVRLEDEPST